MIRLQTVDVWDTLLRRRCHPDAVKRHLAGWLLNTCWPDIVPALRTPHALFALRLDAERELARAARGDPARDDEYRHREVLARWVAKATGTTAPDAAWIDALEAEELAQEQRVVYADPAIAAALAARAPVTTLFLSDFYMPAASLAALLAAQGLDRLVPRGLSSCDVGLNKRSGRLYQALHQEHGLTPAEHAHLGDNRETDVRVARRLGIAAERYRNRSEEKRSAFNRRIFEDRRVLFRDLTRNALASLPAPAQRHARTAFRFGIRSAPLFVGFALFLLEQAARQRHDALYFLSREGAFFSGIYDALRNARASPGGGAPPARNLDISRRASFAASLQAVSPEQMQRLWRGNEPVTMRAWALSLNLDVGVASGWCERHGLALDEPLASPSKDRRVDALLADPACRQTLETHVRSQAALLRDYLAQHGLDRGTAAAAVVDIGWRGTIQDNLALLLPDTRLTGYYLGLQAFLNPQPSNVTKHAYGPDLNGAAAGARVFRRLPLIELLCTPAVGGAIGYRRRDDGSVQAIHTTDESHETQTWRNAVAPFQDGVLQAMPLWAEALRTHAVDSTEIRGEALASWQRILDRTPGVISQARATLPHDERFGRGRFEPPARPRRVWPKPWRLSR
ncbi:MAG: Haloacid dehalogenase domain protein hydrolase [Panacagrimonas sp.]|nr:hypothetical protein [Panacagrimonas sp.]MCC2656687.1 Haloacid dehalogenase domain protein hydrolase [Panacagrimonas sp.]